MTTALNIATLGLLGQKNIRNDGADAYLRDHIETELQLSEYQLELSKSEFTANLENGNIVFIGGGVQIDKCN